MATLAAAPAGCLAWADACFQGEAAPCRDSPEAPLRLAKGYQRLNVAADFHQSDMQSA